MKWIKLSGQKPTKEIRALTIDPDGDLTILFWNPDRNMFVAYTSESIDCRNTEIIIIDRPDIIYWIEDSDIPLPKGIKA